MIIVFTLLVLAAGVIFYKYSLPGTVDYRGWKMSGIWANAQVPFKILIHHNGETLRGHVVSKSSENLSEEERYNGSLIISEVKLKPFWKWSTGVYINPTTHHVTPLRLRLRNKHSMSLRYVDQEGENEIVRKEEWNLVDPLH